MSSAGSPRWASSQSSTARKPGAVDQEVAHPEVAVDHHRLVPGRVGRGPATARPAPGPVAPRGGHRGSRAGGPGDRHGGNPGTDAGSMEWMAARARAVWSVRAGRAAANPSSRRIRRGMVSPSSRSTTSHPGSEPVGGPGGHHLGHRHPGPPGRPQQARLHPDVGIGRAGPAAPHLLQDEGRGPSRRLSRDRRRW